MLVPKVDGISNSFVRLLKYSTDIKSQENAQLQEFTVRSMYTGHRRDLSLKPSHFQHEQRECHAFAS